MKIKCDLLTDAQNKSRQSTDAQRHSSKLWWLDDKMLSVVSPGRSLTEPFLLLDLLLLSFIRCVWQPMDWNMPGFPVLHYLLEFAQTHVHWFDDTIDPSHSLSSPSPVLNLSQPQSFPVSHLFESGRQSTGASASASVLPMNIQDWFPLGLTGLISLQDQCWTLFSFYTFFG